MSMLSDTIKEVLYRRVVLAKERIKERMPVLQREHFVDVLELDDYILASVVSKQKRKDYCRNIQSYSSPYPCLFAKEAGPDVNFNIEQGGMMIFEGMAFKSDGFAIYLGPGMRVALQDTPVDVREHRYIVDTCFATRLGAQINSYNCSDYLEEMMIAVVETHAASLQRGLNVKAALNVQRT